MKTLRTMAAVRRELRRLIEPAVDDKQHELWRRQGDAIADASGPRLALLPLCSLHAGQIHRPRQG
jgi:hypothetical protein